MDNREVIKDFIAFLSGDMDEEIYFSKYPSAWKHGEVVTVEQRWPYGELRTYEDGYQIFIEYELF